MSLGVLQPWFRPRSNTQRLVVTGCAALLTKRLTLRYVSLACIIRIVAISTKQSTFPLPLFFAFNAQQAYKRHIYSIIRSPPLSTVAQAKRWDPTMSCCSRLKA